MTNVRLVLLMAFGLFVAADDGYADDGKIADWAAQLEKASARKAEALGTMTLIDEKMPNLKKERKLFDERIVELAPSVETLVKKFEVHDLDATAVNKKITAHKANCSGQLSKSNYDRCQGEQAYHAKEKARIDKAAEGLEKEKKPLLKQVKLIEDRRAELAKEITKLEGDRDAAKVNLEKAQKTIDALNWDGAKKGLEAPELKPKPLSGTPND
jgi:chromosome segregation ATPase